MKTTGYGLVLAFLLGAGLAGCGRTTDNPKPGSGGDVQPGLGGSTGGGMAGGSTGQGGRNAAGGSGGSTVVPPTVHRPEASSCVGVNSPPEPPSPLPSTSSRCARHADCTEGTNGKCISGIGMASFAYFCVYDECATDADCDAGKVCYCTASSAARCLSVGNCRTDADCGGGDFGYCSPSMGSDCGGYHGVDSYHCHTPADSCMTDSDCTGTDYCNYNVYDARWKCTPINKSCVIG